MSSSEKTVKHMIVTWFFPRQDPRYPYDVLDVDFLSKHLLLAKNNTLRSLENQTNKNFELVFILNEKFFSDKKYDFVFSTLKDSTTLPLTFLNVVDKDKLRRLVRNAFDEYDFVIQSRMDFDDFIYSDAVADTQNKINECNNVLAYGYCKGYTYFNGKLSPYNQLFGNTGHVAILQSLILKSSFAKSLPFMNIYGFNHTKIKLQIKYRLEKNGIAFSEDMFQQNTSTKAYIYYRHGFSHNSLVTNPCDLTLLFQKKQDVDAENLTKKQLEEEFGFHYELNSIK